MRRTRNCTFVLDPRGFVRSTIDDQAEMDLDDARAALEMTAEVAGRKRPVLVDSRRVRWQSREARLYFAGERASEICSAVAVLVGSPVSRMLGNFFIARTQSKFPNRLFSEESPAVDWLLGFVA